MKIDPRGVLLTEKVDVEWLKKLTPQYFKDFIKFHNNKLGATHGNLRLIEDKTTIQLLNTVLQNWVNL